MGAFRLYFRLFFCGKGRVFFFGRNRLDRRTDCLSRRETDNARRGTDYFFRALFAVRLSFGLCFDGREIPLEVQCRKKERPGRRKSSVRGSDFSDPRSKRDRLSFRASAGSVSLRTEPFSVLCRTGSGGIVFRPRSRGQTTAGRQSSERRIPCERRL